VPPPVATSAAIAPELHGMTMKQDLGVAFGLVVRGMGFARRSCWPARLVR